MVERERRMILQGFTGAQPIVVLAFLSVRAAMCIDDLRRETGKSEDALSGAVKALEGKGMLYKQIGAHGKVYYLPAGASFFGFLGGQNPVFPDSGNQNPVFPDSGSVVVAVEQVSLPLQQLTTTTTSGQNPVFPDSGAAGEQVQENLRVFAELEIYGKRPREVAKLPWVNPEYIRAHVAHARALEWPSNPDGYALGQMSEQVPAPKAPTTKARRRWSESIYGVADDGEESEQLPRVSENPEVERIRQRLGVIEGLRPAGSSRVPDEYIAEFRALYHEYFKLKGIKSHE